MVYFSMGKASRKKKNAGNIPEFDSTKLEDKRAGLASKATPLGLILIIVLFSFVVYLNALSNGFAYDDDTQVLKNPWIKDIQHIPEIFSKSVWSFKAEPVISNYYRPLMHMSYMLSYYLFGLKPWGFHLVNILFHAGVSVLVFLITSRLLRESGPSTSSLYFSSPFIAGMLFAAHPIHTEAVTWVAGLPELAFTFFSLLSFYLYLGAKEGVKRNYLLSVASFSLAAFSKETALALPIIFMAYDYVFKKGPIRGIDYLKRYIPYFLVTGVYFLLRIHALGGVAPRKRHADLTTYQYVINIFPLFTQYIEKMLLPVNLNAFHVFHPIVSIFEMKGILSLIITLVFAMFIYVALKKNKVAFFSFFFVVIPLLPVLYIPGLGENTFAERYLYLPSFGFVILCALLGSSLRRNTSRMAAGLTMVSLVLLGLYAVGTSHRNTVWKDDFSLFTDTVRKSPDGVLPHMNLGNAYRDKGLIDGAIQQYLTALQLRPDYAKIYNNLGVAYRAKGLIDEAIQQYQTASKLQPDYAEAHYNLGNAYRAKGLIDEAIQQYQTALQLQPDDAEAHYNLGNAFFAKGLTDEAMEQYQTAVTLRPDYVAAHNNLGNVYLKKGLINEAMGQYQTVLRLKPDDAEAHYNLGNAYLRNGLKDKAIAEFKQALNIRANFAEARRALETLTK